MNMYGGKSLSLPRPEIAPRPQKKPPRPLPRPTRHESMEDGGAILLKNVVGTKSSRGSTENTYIGPGELLVVEGDQYQLYSDPSVSLFLEANSTGILSPEEFSLLEAVLDRGERFRLYKDKLKWGVSLWVGSNVYVSVPEEAKRSLVKQPEARAIVRYRGRVRSNPGTLFGVEILDPVCWDDSAFADGISQGEQYFTCEQGRGLFVTLSEISGPATRPATRGKATTPTSGQNIIHEKSSSLDKKLTKSTSVDAKLGACPSPKIRERKHMDVYENVSHSASNSHEDAPASPKPVRCGKPKHTHQVLKGVGIKPHVASAHEEPKPKDNTMPPPPLRNESLPVSPPPGPAVYVRRSEVRPPSSPGTVGQHRDTSSPDSQREELTYLRRQNERLVAQEQNLIEMQQDQKAKIKELKAELDDKQSKIKSISEQLHRKEQELLKKNKQIASLHEKLDSGDHYSPIQSPSSETETWKVSRKSIQSLPKQQIGFGSWGSVHKARFQGANVAIKIAHAAIFHESTVEMLKREVMIMSRVQHPNLVRFIAAVWDDAVERKSDTPIIVSELMDMNLRAAYSTRNISGSLIPIFSDVAYALHYLHCIHIIHRDISAPNVLLKFGKSGHIQAKISDFGSANLVKQSCTAGAGAILYSAPEMFPTEGLGATTKPAKQTTKVDVYSYGILMLEVAGGEIPTRETSHVLMERVGSEWREMIEHCTQTSPDYRPTMADILYQLNRMTI